MYRDAQTAGERVIAVLHALLILHSLDGEDDGRELNPEAQRGYNQVLAMAAEAGLLSDRERSTLEDVAARWGCHPAVVRELLVCLIAEIIDAARGPGLAAVADQMARNIETG